jgi:hypothetical protein
VAEGGTQRRKLEPRGFDNPPIQLQEQGSVVSELNRRGVEEPAVRLETVAGGEDCGGGLREEVGVLGRGEAATSAAGDPGLTPERKSRRTRFIT